MSEQTSSAARGRGARSAALLSAELQPIVQGSAPQLIAAELRRAIATGRLGPGQQLFETALASSLGVSRGPLREALQRLTQEGLLIAHRNRGVFVMDLDEDAVRDMYLARTAVERAAIEHVIERGRSADAECLLEVVERMRELDDPDSAEVSDADMAFHEALVELAGSPRLSRMHGTLLVQIRMCLTKMQATYDRIEQRAVEHEAIARAVMAGQVEEADRLLIAHMRDGLDRLLVAARPPTPGTTPASDVGSSLRARKTPKQR